MTLHTYDLFDFFNKETDLFYLRPNRFKLSDGYVALFRNDEVFFCRERVLIENRSLGFTIGVVSSIFREEF